MSRIFIENLPKNITESDLRKRFESLGEITDIRLKKDKNHAIIGYKRETEAKNAINYFHKTFINSNKISVKLSAISWNQFSKNKKNDKKNEKEVNEKIDDNIKDNVIKKSNKLNPFSELKDDPEFQEFLKVQRNVDSGQGKHVWSNDFDINDSNIKDSDKSDYKSEEEEEEVEEGEEGEEEEENKDIIIKSKKYEKKSESKAKVMPKDIHEFTVKLRGLPYKIKKRQVKEFLEPLKPMSLRLAPKVKGIAYVSFKTIKELKQALVKHRGFLDGHRIEITKCEVKKAKQTETNAKQNETKWKNAEPAEEPIGESGRIYVRNLSYTCDENDLRELFSKYGPLSEFHLPIDSYTKKQKGFAFITYMFPEHAVKAFSELDRMDFQGRLLHLIPAKAKPDKVEPPFAADKEISFKKKKQIEKKAEANSSHQWNTLFIGANTVADIMSKKFNIKKAELLADSNANDSIAVRMALGETQIVNEMRRFLLDNGISLKSFSETSPERSKNVILVKNLPANTTKDEISALFTKFGLVLRVIIPPNGVTAIVEMQEPNEAKSAFSKLAYNNFKHYPLYLEWAPNHIFRDNSDEKLEAMEDETKSSEKDITDETNGISSENNADIEPEDDTTIFVKNLNFDTNEEDFKNHFKGCGQIHSATIAYKKNTNGLLSLGYGFVQYLYKKSAQKALKEMQHSLLDGHSLELKISNRATKMTQRTDFKKKVNDKQTGTKICVKNIPFEASVKDVKNLFSVFGELKAVRLPKKLAEIGSYRGFGFVDFVTKNDAKRAFDALRHSTHFYGRPLVLEWANDSTDNSSPVDQFHTEAKRVAAKTAHMFNKGPALKRLKKSDIINDLEAKTSITYTDD